MSVGSLPPGAATVRHYGRKSKAEIGPEPSAIDWGNRARLRRWAEQRGSLGDSIRGPQLARGAAVPRDIRKPAWSNQPATYPNSARAN